MRNHTKVLRHERFTESRQADMTCLHCSKVDYWRWNETVGDKEMIVQRYSKTPYFTNFIVWLIYHKSKGLVCIKTDWTVEDSADIQILQEGKKRHT